LRCVPVKRKRLRSSAPVRSEADAYLAMIGGKAALFAVACELGALVAGATPERTRAYARLGRTSGMAFQMENHVQSDPQSRTWALPGIASLATARAYLADGDAAASAAGIDASGRVRAFFARAIRPPHEYVLSTGGCSGAAHRRAFVAWPLIAILFAGLVVRILLLPSLGFHNDVSAFEAWTLTLKDNPPWQFYAKTSFADYPPGYFIVLWGIAGIYSTLAHCT